MLLQAKRAHDEAVLVAAAAPHAATALAVEHLAAAVALAAHHEPEPPAGVALGGGGGGAPVFVAARREEGEEAAVLVEGEHLGGAADVAAADEQARGHGLLPRDGPELVPEAPVHGHVPLLERDVEVLQQRAHAVAVLERLADAAERGGVEHHRPLPSRRAPRRELPELFLLLLRRRRGNPNPTLLVDELPIIDRLRPVLGRGLVGVKEGRVVGERVTRDHHHRRGGSPRLGRRRRRGRGGRKRGLERAQDPRLERLDDHGGDGNGDWGVAIWVWIFGKRVDLVMVEEEGGGRNEEEEGWREGEGGWGCFLFNRLFDNKVELNFVLVISQVFFMANGCLIIA